MRGEVFIDGKFHCETHVVGQDIIRIDQKILRTGFGTFKKVGIEWVSITGTYIKLTIN